MSESESRVASAAPLAALEATGQARDVFLVPQRRHAAAYGTYTQELKKVINQKQ